MLGTFSEQIKPTAEERAMNITVYCGSNFGDNPHFEEAARNLGAWIARAGHALVYGGSSVGLMGAVSRAAIEGGAPVIGVEPAFFIEAGVAQHDLTELIVCDTMGERKAKMIELGDAFVALREAWARSRKSRKYSPGVRLDMGPHECFLLNIDGFYDRSLVSGIDGRAPLFRPVRPGSLPLPALRGRAGTPSEHGGHASHHPLRRPVAAESRVKPHEGMSGVPTERVPQRPKQPSGLFRKARTA